MHFSDIQRRLDPEASEPVALQAARLLAGEMLDGRLPPGTALPGSRALAEALGMTRFAAMSALRELELEGWVETRPGSGTYVRDPLPGASRLRPASPVPHMAERPAFELSSRLEPLSSLREGVLDLTEGRPDPRLCPQEALGQAWRRALRRHGDDLLARREPRGEPTLREHLALHLRDHRALKVDAGHLLITRGLAMTAELLGEALLGRGGHAAVEDPGDPALREALARAPGVRLHPVPVDGGGLDVEALARLAGQVDLALVAVTPQRQVPTTVPLAPGRREALLDLARRRGFALLEVDPDLELHGPGGPALPLASGDAEGRVLHAGSLSGLLAPGLALDYLVAPRTLVDRLARLKDRRDLQGDRVLEWAVADLMRDGDLARHLARFRHACQVRREAFLEGLARHLPALRPVPAPGGMALWAALPCDLDAGAGADRARALGVRLRPGRAFAFDGRDLPGLRLGFAHLAPEEAEEGLRRLLRALPGGRHG